MNLELRSVANRGDIERERITFRVTADVDVGDFVVMQSGYVDGEVTTDIHHSFWFAYKPIEKGDLVVLYTKSGNMSSRPLKQRGLVHFFYWGLDMPIWQHEDRAAVLLAAPTWQSKSSIELAGR